MFRFTIRDLLWLMVVVGLALGWLNDRYAMYQHLIAVQKAETARQRAFHKMESEIYEQKSRLEKYYEAREEAAVDRELDLKTTVNALKLRLGEDPLSRQSATPASP
jgi:hypothetical protein